MITRIQRFATILQAFLSPGCALLVALGVFLGPLAVTSHASVTPTQSVTIPANDTDWSPGHLTTGTDPIPLTKFDPSLGTLRAVNLSLGYTFTQDMTAKFDSPATIALSVQNKSVEIDRPDGSSLLSASPADTVQSKTLTSGPFPQSFDLPRSIQNGTAGPISLTSSADLSLFLGSSAGDTLFLPVSARANSTYTTDTGNGLGVTTVKAGAEVSLSYTYDAVPEPSTLAILGIGCVVLLNAARRRR
ncbi:MAG: hypothetical protein NVSMB9_02760 [Isosphaeraceae bacterium]